MPDRQNQFLYFKNKYKVVFVWNNLDNVLKKAVYHDSVITKINIKIWIKFVIWSHFIFQKRVKSIINRNKRKKYLNYGKFNMLP